MEWKGSVFAGGRDRRRDGVGRHGRCCCRTDVIAFFDPFLPVQASNRLPDMNKQQQAPRHEGPTQGEQTHAALFQVGAQWPTVESSTGEKCEIWKIPERGEASKTKRKSRRRIDVGDVEEVGSPRTRDSVSVALCLWRVQSAQGYAI